MRWRASVAGLAGLALAAGLWGAAADDKAAEERLKKDISFLASPECEGRGVTTQGINLAADYIRDTFKKAGLQPGSPNPGYYQPFTMGGAAKLGSPNQLVLKGPLGQDIELEAGKGFQPMGLSASGKLAAPIVFAGYGVVAKEENYDDFAGLDVANKIVLLIRRAPRYDNDKAGFGGAQKNFLASFTTKFSNAEQRKAAAVLLVNDRGSAQQGDSFVNFNELSRGGSPVGIPVLQIRRSDADAMLQAALGVSLRQLEEDIDRDLKPRSAPLPGWHGSLEVNVSRPRIDVKNVIGVLEGAGPLADETIVIGAHYDHLGFGGPGSLAKGSTAIHHGADDNASGTTVLMELARRFAAKKDRQGRRLVFIAFSAEESGLLGSEHYCKNPLFPLEKTAAMVNFDMVGRVSQDAKSGKDKLTVYGTGTAKTFDKLIETFNEKHQFQLSKVPAGMGPSDHASFYMRKIPVFHMFTGTHPDYHKPSDTWDKINIAGMRKIADLSEELIEHLAAVKERPEYVKVAGGTPGASPGNVPRIGIRPAYDDDGKDGVLVSGVTEGLPAAKAGIKDGDRIIEVSGMAVKNLEAYMTQMTRFKKGEKVPLTILRGTEKKLIEVIPE